MESMDSSDAFEMSKRSGPLAVSKTSGKIGKGLRRPIVQPRPAPTVYKIEAGHFRSLVQELTGTAPTEPAVPKSTGNSRLHKIAPPPLRPTFSYTKLGVQPIQQFAAGLPPLPSPPNNGGFGNIPFSGFGASLSPVPNRLALLSPHTFSPLPALSPNDQVWANPLESPTSAAMRSLAQSIASIDSQSGNYRLDNSNGGGSLVQTTFPSVSTPNFSLSPRLSTQYPNLPSPTGIGMASGFAIGNLYQMGALHSPTAAMAKDFSFPEPDFALTGFS